MADISSPYLHRRSLTTAPTGHSHLHAHFGDVLPERSVGLPSTRHYGRWSARLPPASSRTALATIVSVEGSEYRRPGARMLIDESGRTTGAISGGCVALETQYRPVVVVLGSHAEAVREKLAGTEARVVVNREWAEGMSSSIRCGLRALETGAKERTEAVILMLCDQPFVTSDIIRRLVDVYLTRRTLIVASEYEAEAGRTRGVPALFSRPLFAELMELRGAAGAKRIIARHEAASSIIAVPEAAFDVDTPDDYLALHKPASGGAEDS